MEHLLLSFRTVLPMLLVISLGIFYRRVLRVGRTFFEEVDRLNFKVFLPVMLFYNIYTATLDEGFSGKLAVFCLGSMCALVFIYILILSIIEKDKGKRGAMFSSLIGRNYIVIGVAIINALYGEGNLGPLFLITMGCIPIVTISSTVVLETYRGGKTDLKKIITRTLLNPFVVATLLGFVVLLSGFRFPALLETAIGDVAKIGTPLALFLLGSLLEFNSIKGNVRSIGKVMAIMIAVGVLFVSLGVLLGFRGMQLAVIMIVFLAPTSVTSATLVGQLEGDAKLSGQLILLSTFLSVILLFLCIFICKAKGLF